MQLYQLPPWKQAPFIRLLMPLCSGILLQWHLSLHVSYVLLLLVAGIIFLAGFYRMPLKMRYRYQHWQGLCMMICLFFFGMFLTWSKDIREDPRWFMHHYRTGDSLLVVINTPLQEKNKTFKATGLIKAIIRNQDSIQVSGQMLLYFSKKEGPLHLSYGDLIGLSASPSQIKHSGNPAAFDYARYSAMQQIRHTAYLQKKQWKHKGQNEANPFNKWIYQIRDGIIDIIKKYMSQDKDVLGIAEALLIGYKEDLDRDLMQEYTKAGVVHIIAISGLHLGLIYMMLTQLLSRTPLIRKHKLTQYLICIAALWLFSLVTGASASVLRSAVMFTCILAGKMISRHSSVYHSLTASAFILLCYNPYLLWDVGFQLSYLALAGIILLQKPIQNIFYLKHTWLRKIWELMAVTLAAQTGTLPICLFYFHQFPAYFFLSNMVAVPLSTLILFVEMAVLALSWSAPLASLCAQLAIGLIRLMNQCIRLLNNLPGSLITNIYADIPTCICLHAFVICLAAWLIMKKKFWLLYTGISAILLVLFHTLADIRDVRRKEMVFYQIPGYTAIDFFYKGNHLFFGSDTLKQNNSLVQFHIMPSRISKQAYQPVTKIPAWARSRNLIRFCNKTILIIDSNIRFRPAEKKIAVDIVLLSGNPSVKLSDITQFIKPDLVVISSSNSLWKIAAWKKECRSLPLRCFSIPDQGALTIPVG